jgi:polyisoprenyl-teichoic acid--peptidoglycan teichoic acid transferase
MFRRSHTALAVAAATFAFGIIPAAAQDPPALPPPLPEVTTVPPPTTVPQTVAPTPPTAPQSTAPQSTAPIQSPTSVPPAASTTTTPRATTVKPAASSKATTTVRATTTTKPSGAATRNKAGQYLPNGKPTGPAATFDWAGSPVPNGAAAAAKYANPSGYVTALIIGSDARPKENVERTRGDSIHLIMWNQNLGKGTILGIPRDTWVPIAGKGDNRVNASLTWGGPDLMRGTVANFTKIGVDRWVLTGFEGFTKLVNDLGGLSVEVKTPMNDPYSGAQFMPGWFNMNGDATLALARNRKDGVLGGDIGRSANQGQILLHLLGKAREQTKSMKDLAKWVVVARRDAKSNASATDMLALAHLARSIDPAAMTVVVLPVQNATIGKAAVQTMTPAAETLLVDLRTDGVVNGR